MIMIMNNVNLCRRRGGISSPLVTVLLSLDHRIIPHPAAAPSSFQGERTDLRPGTKNREFAIFAEARTRITQKVRTRTKTKTLLYDDTPYCDCMKSGVCGLMGNHTKRIFFPTRRTPETDATSPFLALLRYAKLNKFFIP